MLRPRTGVICARPRGIPPKTIFVLVVGGGGAGGGAVAGLDDLRLARVLTNNLSVVRVGAGVAIGERIAAVADDRDVDAGVGDADGLFTGPTGGPVRADRLNAAERGTDCHRPVQALAAGTKGV